MAVDIDRHRRITSRTAVCVRRQRQKMCAESHSDVHAASL